MNQKAKFSMNIGLPSIFLIFVVLCLVSFGILSLVSANSDRKLSQKVLARSANYYESCNQAEDMLAETNSTLLAAYLSSNDEAAYWNAIQNIPASYSFPISDLQNLQVTLTFLYPKTKEEAFFQIDSWKVVTTSDLEYDEQLHVIP